MMTDPSPVVGDFKTSELNMAAYLLAHRVPLKDSERVGSRMTFVFQASPQTQRYAHEFMNNGPVRVGDYVHARYTLMQLIHQQEERAA